VRDSVRRILLAPPIEPGARLALAGLEGVWGSAADGWLALRDLPVDSASTEAWIEFGTRAEREGRWPLARDAFDAALKWRANPDVALRAANAAIESGDPNAALTLAPLPPSADSAVVAERYVPIHTRALALLGRPLVAEKLVQAYDRFFTPGARARMSRQVAFGWVRTGDMMRARAALVEAGADGDSSETAGWLALYEGNLKTARLLLRRGGESTPELALALGLIARLPGDTATAVGAAFLALARGDTTKAAERFEQAGASSPSVASLLLMTAAQLRSSARDEPGALALWQRVVEQHADSPEAPAAELEWARVLRRRRDLKAAAERLEHLIITYPQSSLLPQARRELELVRQTIPGSG
jgi:tetratricopeptide (TPR) repeat protein